jgi:cephalosporin hydroxylase
MDDACPHLDYREGAGEKTFETARAYCAVVDEFVEPMRADVCNARYGLAPDEHCEFYRAHEADDEEDA